MVSLVQPTQQALGGSGRQREGSGSRRAVGQVGEQPRGDEHTSNPYWARRSSRSAVAARGSQTRLALVGWGEGQGEYGGKARQHTFDVNDTALVDVGLADGLGLRAGDAEQEQAQALHHRSHTNKVCCCALTDCRTRRRRRAGGPGLATTWQKAEVSSQLFP